MNVLDLFEEPLQRIDWRGFLAKGQKPICVQCHQKTSPKSYREHAGMCGGCARVWERYGITQTLANIPIDAETFIREGMVADPNWRIRLAAQCRREYPLQHPNRDWDLVLVIAVDERRRRREEGRYR